MLRLFVYDTILIHYLLHHVSMMPLEPLDGLASISHTVVIQHGEV